MAVTSLTCKRKGGGTLAHSFRRCAQSRPFLISYLNRSIPNKIGVYSTDVHIREWSWLCCVHRTFSSQPFSQITTDANLKANLFWSIYPSLPLPELSKTWSISSLVSSSFHLPPPSTLILQPKNVFNVSTTATETSWQVSHVDECMWARVLWRKQRLWW